MAISKDLTKKVFKKYWCSVKTVMNCAIKVISNQSDVEMNNKIANIVINVALRSNAPPIYSKTF